jgi:hypothetical protein
LRSIILIIAGLFLLVSENSGASSKIDTIYLQEGDRITGEVKSLENNYLKFSTDDVGTVNIKWTNIDSVKVLNKMRILLADGQIYYGILMPSGEDGSCYIWATIGDPRLTPLVDIVMLSPLEDKFFHRITGTLSSGFSYTKASDILQVSLNGTLKYTAQKNQIKIAYDGILTQQDSSASTQRQSGNLDFIRILSRNWFVISSLTAESNSEQDLDLRTGLSGGGGKSLVHSNSSNLYIAAGIQASRELSKGDVQNSLESFFSSNYSIFIYDSPKITFNLTGKLAPSLSDFGRIRADIDSNISWEIFNDFYLKWTFYYSYDSRPLSTTASKGDWAISLLGLEYKL